METPSPQDIEKRFLDAYETYADAIYRHCYFRVYEKNLAEDLTQETFIKTWNYLVQGKEIDNIKAFLYKVAVNLVIDYKRKKQSLPLDDMKEKQVSLRHSTVEEGFMNTVEMHRIIEKMDQLEDSYREVITMRYINDLSPVEIAEILQITPNAVSVKINYAIKKLKQVIYQH